MPMVEVGSSGGCKSAGSGGCKTECNRCEGLANYPFAVRGSDHQGLVEGGVRFSRSLILSGLSELSVRVMRIGLLPGAYHPSRALLSCPGSTY
jgi:hypothetical protein